MTARFDGIPAPMQRRRAYLILLGLGTIWGFTVPMMKLAVSEGNQPFGLIFWELLLAVVILGAFRKFKGRSLRPSRVGIQVFLMVALLGTLLPGAISYRAAAELPAGIMAIITAMVPLFALPVALLLRLERLNLGRILGVLLGVVAIGLLVGPSDSLPDSTKIMFVVFALFSPFFYAMEGNYLNWRGDVGLLPSDVIYGASMFGLIIVAPLTFSSGQFIAPWEQFGVPEWALVASSVCHIFAYVGYVGLIVYAGSVFAAQIAYIITGTGVIWSMVLLGESYSIWVWGAMALIMLAVTLVQPRAPAKLPAPDANAA